MADARTKDTPPALFDHCRRAYEELIKEGRCVRVSDEMGDYRDIIIWEGMFTNFIVNRLNLSTPYFTSIRRELIRMGCIRQLRRGGGSSPSQWELIREPGLDLFYQARPLRTQNVQTDKFTGMRSELNALVRRIADLEKAFAGLLDALNTPEDKG